MKKIIVVLLLVLLTGCNNKDSNEKKLLTNEKLQFANSSISYENGMSTITTTITNPNDINKILGSFTIKIETGEDHTHLYELIVNVNKEIKAGETLTISSNCEDDLTQNTKIEYSEGTVSNSNN